MSLDSLRPTSLRDQLESLKKCKLVTYCDNHDRAKSQARNILSAIQDETINWKDTGLKDEAELMELVRLVAVKFIKDVLLVNLRANTYGRDTFLINQIVGKIRKAIKDGITTWEEIGISDQILSNLATGKHTICGHNRKDSEIHHGKIVVGVGTDRHLDYNKGGR